MPRIAYVNGRYVHRADGAVNIEDRGYQFADGVYEVCLVVDGRYWDETGHLARWTRSLRELEIAAPVGEPALKAIMATLLAKNRLKDALVYMQATRGVAPRNHPFPARPTRPILVMTAKPFNLGACNAQAAKGVGVISAPDIRWGRADIKSISLLPNVLAKEAARRAGCAEAWLHRNEVVTEGAASNAWIVAANGDLVTHPLGPEILGGITRAAVIDCARQMNLKLEERAFTLDEAMTSAREAFLTSATNLVMPVISIDGRAIAGGRPGPTSLALREAYLRRGQTSR